MLILKNGHVVKDEIAVMRMHHALKSLASGAHGTMGLAAFQAICTASVTHHNSPDEARSVFLMHSFCIGELQSLGIITNTVDGKDQMSDVDDHPVAIEGRLLLQAAGVRNEDDFSWEYSDPFSHGTKRKGGRDRDD